MQQFVDTREFLSQTKFYEGYSRFKENENRYETWDEAVDRVINMHDENYINNNNELFKSAKYLNAILDNLSKKLTK